MGNRAQQERQILQDRNQKNRTHWENIGARDWRGSRKALFRLREAEINGLRKNEKYRNIISSFSGNEAHLPDPVITLKECRVREKINK